MSEPITGELRRRMDTLGWYDEDGNIVFTTGGLPAGDVACLAINSETFGELCDRIDAEHERELRETGEDIVRDVKREWIHLPLDADGEPIHAGDVLDGYGKTIEVVEIRYGRSGWVLISRDGNGYADTFAFTHHHADSWERIINDAVNVHGNGFNPCWTDECDALIARCKALAGDAE